MAERVEIGIVKGTGTFCLDGIEPALLGKRPKLLGVRPINDGLHYLFATLHCKGVAGSHQIRIIIYNRNAPQQV